MANHYLINERSRNIQALSELKKVFGLMGNLGQILSRVKMDEFIWSGGKMDEYKMKSREGNRCRKQVSFLQLLGYSYFQHLELSSQISKHILNARPFIPCRP